MWHSFATSVQDWLGCCPASTAYMQAHLSHAAGPCDTGEAHFQLPPRAAQLVGAGNQPSLLTPAWARVQRWTPQQSNPLSKLLTKLIGTTEHFRLRNYLLCVTWHLFLFLPFPHRRNESIKPQSFLPKCSSCAIAFFKIQDLVLPAANWRAWFASCRIRHIQMEHICKDHLSK